MPMGEDPRHGLLVALVVALVGVLLLIFAAVTVAPALVIVLGLMTYVVWWYVSREDTSFMHHAQEHENRFWTTVAFCFSGALVFVHDSPVAVGQWSPVLGFLVVMVFTFSVHSYDRQLHRSRIGRAPNFRPTEEGNRMLHTCVQDKCRRVRGCLAKLDNRLVATNLNHMLWADMVQNLEKEIVTILSDAEPAELNDMLPKIGLGLLFYKVKDHFPTNLHRTRLLDLLAVTRISELSVTSRAHVLDALQQMKLSAHRKSAHYARNVILKTKGDELSELKSLTDAKGDIHSLHKLVYQDIKDSAIRDEVLKHIATQAKVQAAHMKLGTRTGSRRSGKAWRKILSDVDDTLTSSGGRFPAGVDRRYPRKSVYPGVLDFYRELDLGVNGASEWPPEQLGNLVFLSARPHVYKDVSESKSYAKFKKLKDEKGLYTTPTLLAGDIDTGRTMLLTGNMEPVAEKKFQNFAEYVTLYPEFKHIFVGDNGQGDVRAAEMMAERYPGSLEAVYMHRVVPEEKTFGYQGPDTRARWKRANIVFFGDYVEAACHAYKRGLIQAVGLQRVCQAAVQQFVDMKFEGPLEREPQRRQINQSVWKANKLLQAANLEPNWLIRAVRAFDDMEAVLTPFGRGIVVNFRPEDGVYEVLLDWSQKTTSKPATAPVTPLHGRAHTSGLSSPVGPPRPTLPARPTSLPALGTGTITASRTIATAPSPPLLQPLAGSPLPPTPRLLPATLPPPGSTAALNASSAPVAAAVPPAAGTGGAGGGGRNALPIVVMPQRGPDAAGGGEAVRDARVRGHNPGGVNPILVPVAVPLSRTTTAESAAAVATSNDVAAAAAAAALVRANEAEEAAGVPYNRLRGRGGALGGAAGAVPAMEAVTGPAGGADVVGDMDVGAAGEGLGRPPSAVSAFGGVGGGGGEDGRSPTGSGMGASPYRREDGPLVPWVEGTWPSADASVDSTGSSRFPGPPRDEAVAARVLAASTPGSMVVRAYLQLPSLKKAPPEPKKVTYKDEGEESKSGRLSTRLSLFRSGADPGTASTRSPAKAVVAKGTVVQTFMGLATVRNVRAEDGMCEVAFQKWVLRNGKPAFAVLRLADVVIDAAATAATASKSPSLLGRTGKAISSLFKLSADPAAAPPTTAPAEPRVGDIVETIFGPAAITHVRAPLVPASPAARAWADTTSDPGSAKLASRGDASPSWSRAASAGATPVSAPASVAPLKGPQQASPREGTQSQRAAPLSVLASASPRRRRSSSVTAAVDPDSSSAFSSIAEGGELGAPLSSRGAGVLLPGKLFTSSVAVTPGSGQGRRKRRSAPPPSPATPGGEEVSRGLSPLLGGGSDGDEGEEGSSPLGVKILERRGSGGERTGGGGASPTDAVMYEVAFMMWRVGNNTPARAVLNRASIWAEWERRPPGAGSGSQRGRSSGGRHKEKQQSRPSSFFGFMSMVGGLGGGSGATTKMITPPGSPQRSRPPKSPARSAAAPVHRCDFSPGTCVRTACFGPAIVVKFRAEDGIYQASLLNWRLQSGRLASAYLSRTAIVTAIAVPGAAVRTPMGLGNVELVREDGVVVVVSRAGGGDGGAVSSDRTRARGGAMMFLQLSSVIGPAKAIVGERVDTALGAGVIRAYSIASDTYLVDLGWGVVHTPHGSAIREKRTAATSHPLSARSSGGIIKLFRWPLFGGATSTILPPVV